MLSTAVNKNVLRLCAVLGGLKTCYVFNILVQHQTEDEHCAAAMVRGRTNQSLCFVGAKHTSSLKMSQLQQESAFHLLYTVFCTSKTMCCILYTIYQDL
jgi:hypothetical protein